RNLLRAVSVFAPLLLVGVQALPSAAEGDTPNLVGMQATYSVTSTGVDRLTAVAMPGDGGSLTSTAAAPTTSTTVTVDSAVTAQTDNQLTVHSLVTKSGTSRAFDYVVSAGAIIPPIPGSQTPIAGSGVSFQEDISVTG